MLTHEQSKVLTAADSLEDIATIATAMAEHLRGGASDPYARVYWLRHHLSAVVARLGAGTPQAAMSRQFDDEYVAYVADARRP